MTELQNIGHLIYFSKRIAQTQKTSTIQMRRYEYGVMYTTSGLHVVAKCRLYWVLLIFTMVSNSRSK